MGVGKLTVVVGPMMSEKSTTVYRYVSRALRSKRKVEVCTHVLDKRWGGDRFTHSGLTLAGLKIRPRVVTNSLELWEGLVAGVQALQ